MTISEIKENVKTSDYDFLKTNKNLGKNIILLTLGGSYAYGMNTVYSDVDIRGISLNSKQDILLSNDFEQVVDKNTDTVIYSFNKIIDLLTKCNPNTIEILGCLPEHYLYLSDIGEELLNNKKMFLSQICVRSFGGYSSDQLRRLSNKAVRKVSQTEHENYILKSIENAKYTFKEKYFPYNDGNINLYIDTAIQEGYDSEVFMDLTLKHYPLRDYTGMWNEMKTIVSAYNKIGKRNEKASSHDKLGKHMAHSLRLYMMCIDILEKGEINTYRTTEHDLLMDIRNGKYLNENDQPLPEFYELVDEYEKRFDYAKKNTSLPESPDYKAINEFKMYVNERIIRGDI